MKKRGSILFGISIVATLVVVGVVGTNNSTTVNAQTSTETARQLELNKNMANRLQERKAAATTKLTTVQEKRLQTRCKGGQTHITGLSTKATTAEANRSKVHDALINRLTSLQAKLDAKNADTTKLKANIAELQAKIAVFKTDLAAYQLIISDTAAMDCAADPAAFKASLDQARVALKKVHDDAAAIRSYTKDTVKVTLKEIRASLVDKEAN